MQWRSGQLVTIGGMVCGALLFGAVQGVSADEPSVSLAPPSPRAVDAMRLLTSGDPYQRQLGFLRLEALREMSTVATIRTYATSRDPQTRAYSLRAVAAVEGAPAIPWLLEAWKRERDPLVRRAVLLGLEPLQRDEPHLLSVFLKALQDRNLEVSMAAVDIVSRIDDPRAREAIRSRWKRERRRDVRRVLALALKRLDGRTEKDANTRTLKADSQVLAIPPVGEEPGRPATEAQTPSTH